MARPKKDAKLEEEVELEVNEIHKDILKDFGDCISDGQSILDQKEVVISAGAALDLGLGGGIPMGCGVILNGDAKAGKTSTALQIAANGQNNEELLDLSHGVVKVFYHDLESRLKQKNVGGIKGLDLKNFHVFRSEKGKMLTGEQQLEIVEKCIQNHPYSINIVDSFSILATETELTETIDKQQRADSNKLVSKFVRRNIQPIRVNQCMLIGMTWNMANPSGYGAGKVEKSPGALKYMQDVKLIIKKADPWIVDDARIGQIINWKVDTSALGPPGAEVQSYLRYGVGLDKVNELMNIGVTLGLIIQSGAWYKLEFLSDNYPEAAEKKCCGANGVCKTLEENPEYQTELFKQIMEMT